MLREKEREKRRACVVEKVGQEKENKKGRVLGEGEQKRKRRDERGRY